LEKWLIDLVMSSEAGKEKLSGLDLTKARKIIVVQRGRAINFVL